MADLIKIEKGGKSALCEERQLAAYLGDGWVRAAVDPAAEAEQVDVPLAPGLFRITKGDRSALCDEKNWPRLEEKGWARGEAPAEAEAEAGGEDEDPEGLAAILAGLDPFDDDLWNKDGSVKLAALNETFQLEETKASVEAAWPGFNREALTQDDDQED